MYTFIYMLSFEKNLHSPSQSVDSCRQYIFMNMFWNQKYNVLQQKDGICHVVHVQTPPQMLNCSLSTPLRSKQFYYCIGFATGEMIYKVPDYKNLTQQIHPAKFREKKRAHVLLDVLFIHLILMPIPKRSWYLHVEPLSFRCICSLFCGVRNKVFFFFFLSIWITIHSQPVT